MATKRKKPIKHKQIFAENEDGGITTIEVPVVSEAQLYTDVRGVPLKVGDKVNVCYQGFNQICEVKEQNGKKYISGHILYTLVEDFNGIDVSGRLYTKIESIKGE